jgi:hypothetical protein
MERRPRVEHTIRLRLWQAGAEDLWGLFGYMHYMPCASNKSWGFAIYSTAFPEFAGAFPCGAVLVEQHFGKPADALVRVARIAVHPGCRGHHIFQRTLNMLGAWITSTISEAGEQRVMRISMREESDASNILFRTPEVFEYIGPPLQGPYVKDDDEPKDNFEYVGGWDTAPAVFDLFGPKGYIPAIKKDFGITGGAAAPFKAKDWGELTSTVSYCPIHQERLTFTNNNSPCYCKSCDGAAAASS